MTKILALTRYGPLAASTRQRFLQYKKSFEESGLELSASPLMDDEHMRRLVRGQSISVLATVTAYARRLRALVRARDFDVLWLHCESFPFLPGHLELLIRLSGRPVVYDFDDAIFHIYDSSRVRLVKLFLGNKLKPLLRRVSACTVGNEYLASYARQYCNRTVIIPTVVDTGAYLPISRKAQRSGVIGWIGSPSTWPQVRPLLPVLREICRSSDWRFRVIGSGQSAAADAFDEMDLVDWSEQTEIAEVQSMDIGIMPLVDSPFVRGKSGYKLIQYMACGLPTVASPIGVNREIVVEGETGFLATSEAEWEVALRRLIIDAPLRQRLGAAGRARAVSDYSLASQAPRLIALFKEVAGRPDRSPGAGASCAASAGD